MKKKVEDDFLLPLEENQEEEIKKDEPSIFFDLLGSISETKKDYSEHERFEKDYNPFTINEYFSRFTDTVIQANTLNRYLGAISKKAHYRYLLNTVKKRKRFEKNQKSETESLNLIAQYYGFNMSKAAQALALLGEDNLKIIKQKFNKGGTR